MNRSGLQKWNGLGYKNSKNRYPQNRLASVECILDAKETDAEKKNIFVTFVLKTSKTIRNKDIPNREPVPLVA